MLGMQEDMITVITLHYHYRWEPGGGGGAGGSVLIEADSIEMTGRIQQQAERAPLECPQWA